MSNQQLLFPENVKAKLEKLYASRQHIWLHDKGDWPLTINIGLPSEKQAIEQQPIVLSWVMAWRNFHGPFEVTWRERHWRLIGVQSLPEKMIIEDTNAFADTICDGARWRRAAERFASLRDRWPNVYTEAKVLFPALADFDDYDFNILRDVVQWFLKNPNSRLYPRHLPVKGAHTKWLEGHMQVVCALLACADGRENKAGSLEFLGLCEPPVLWRMRILDPALRQSLNNLEDLSAPIQDLQRLSISPKNVFIVENLQTFLAFEDLKESVVLLGMGFRVRDIGTIPWLNSARCIYWGDLDTAGFAILDLARSAIPHLESVLMDQEALLAHQKLWVLEKKQNSATMLQHLTAQEAEVYDELKSQRWGTNIRLEQERIPWEICWERINRFATAKR